MRSFVLPLLASLLFGGIDLDLGLPPQPDLDLPVVPEHYDPTNPAPGPTPPPPEADDPRDEPPPVFYGEEIESENDTLYYVIDLSGSMRRDGRIDRARRELELSIKGLSPNIRFNVIAYNCHMTSWRPGLSLATEENKASAIMWTAELEPQGGTATGPAVALALNDQQCMAIALLTDGSPNCGAMETAGHRQMILNANDQHATISVFGVDAKGEWRAFCVQVASDSSGSYYDVP